MKKKEKKIDFPFRPCCDRIFDAVPAFLDRVA